MLFIWIWGTISRHGKTHPTYTDVFFIPLARFLGRMVRNYRHGNTVQLRQRNSL
jgi:hypothetical protein